MLQFGSISPLAVSYSTAAEETEDIKHRIQNEHGGTNVRHRLRSSIFETKARLQERLNLTYPVTILVGWLPCMSFSDGIYRS